MSKESVLIGLTGGMCSGKNTFGDYLVNNYASSLGAGRVISSSDAAREYIATHNLGEPTRDLTRVTATRLRQLNSPTYLIDWALGQFAASERLRVISGIYTVPESNYVRQLGGLVVAIDTPDVIRQTRMSQRARTGEENMDEFTRLDSEDMQATATDQEVAAVMRSADVLLTHVSTAEFNFRTAAAKILDLMQINYEGARE